MSSKFAFKYTRKKDISNSSEYHASKGNNSGSTYPKPIYKNFHCISIVIPVVEQF